MKFVILNFSFPSKMAAVIPSSVLTFLTPLFTLPRDRIYKMIETHVNYFPSRYIFTGISGFSLKRILTYAKNAKVFDVYYNSLEKEFTIR